MSEDDIKVIDKQIKDIIAEAAQFSQDSPEPPPEDLWTDVLMMKLRRLRKCHQIF